jgi:hypothetical protein
VIGGAVTVLDAAVMQVAAHSAQQPAEAVTFAKVRRDDRLALAVTAGDVDIRRYALLIEAYLRTRVDSGQRD